MTGFFINILNWINNWIGNYGWAVIVFTLFVKLVLLPLDVRSRKSMRAMSQLNPELEKLKKRYANDQEKLNKKTQELYRNAHVNPLSGCLPLLIQMPILFIMFAAMRRVAAQQQVNMIYKWAQASGLANVVDGQYSGLNWQALVSVSGDITSFNVDFGDTQSWFWIKSVFQADNMNRFAIPTVSELNTTLQQYGQYITDLNAKAFVQDYISALGLSASDKITIIKAIIESSNIADSKALLESIQTFISGTAVEGVNLDTIMESIRTAGIGTGTNAYETLRYLLDSTAAFDDTAREGILAYVSMLGVNSSVLQHATYLLNSNAATAVFGSQIDTALKSTVNSYTGSILGFITIAFPTKFNRYINGYFILPILACATQVLSTKLQPTNAADTQTSNQDGSNPAAGTGKIMKWLFPIMSLWICWTSTAAFAIYWVFVNVWSIVSSYGINLYLGWKEKRDRENPKPDKNSKNDKNKKEALQP